MSQNKLLEAALKYLEMGFSVIPIIAGDKKPLVKWEPFQKERATRNQLISWWSNSPEANVGIITGKISGIDVIDIDSDTGRQNILEYIPDSFIAPTVRTPRGGEHLYCQHVDGLTNKAGVITGTDFRGEGGYVLAPPSSNGSGTPYLWMEGLSIDEVSPAIIPNKYISTLYRDVDTGKVFRPQTSTLSTNVYREGRRDQDLFHIANLLVKARCEPEYLQKTLEIIALSCDPPFPLGEAQAKIESALKRADRRDRNLMQDLREHLLSTSGVILSTNVAKCLQVSTREELKNLSICFKRAITEGLCAKYGNQSGCFRVADTEEELIDYENADLTPYNVRFPLRIEDYVIIHKGNIIVIAGESNAGKTAFLLNVALKNCKDFPVNYMSSEMQNGAELRVRMDKFDNPISAWKPIKFQFRTDNFPDKVEPDGLNIVDYLDEGNEQEASKMPMRIRQIADKLKAGIAIVAIQKNPEKEFGFGGAGTLNRSRLYLTITAGNIMKIKKAKMWRNDFVNPNGLWCNFTLVAGCKFKIVGESDKAKGVFKEGAWQH